MRQNFVARLTHPSLETRALLAILAAALLLRVLPLGSFSTEYDEGVYWLSLRAMAQGHALYSAIYYAQPPFFLLSIYPLFALLGQTLLAARFAVALFSLGGIVALYVIGKGLAGRYVGLAAALLLAVDPLYLRVSHTLDAEAPALALMLAGIAFAVEALPRAGRTRRLFVVASGALLGLAVMTKLFAVAGIVPVALLLVWPQLAPRVSAPAGSGRTRRRAGSRRDQLRRAARDLRTDWPAAGWLLAGILGACVVVLAPFFGSRQALYTQVVGVHLAAAHALDRGLAYNINLIAGRMGDPGISLWLALAALVGVAVAVWRRALVMIPVAAWELASLILLLAQQPLFWHHTALLVPPLTLLAALLLRLAPPLPPRSARRRAHATTRTLRALRQPTLVTYVALILLGATAVLSTIGAALDDQHAIQYTALDQVRISYDLGTMSLAGEPVVTDAPYLAGLAGRNVPPELIDTSLVRIQTGNLTAKQLEDIITASGIHAILFASGRFDAVPGFRAWVRQNYSVGKDFGGGRVLYLKQPQGPVFA